MARVVETLRKYLKPITIVGAVGLLLYIVLNEGTQAQESQPSLISKELGDQATAEPLNFTNQATEMLNDSCDGVFYPPYGFCYPYVPILPGESWDACVALPPETTVWGAISAINGDPKTPTDSARASVLIYNRDDNTLRQRYDLNPQLPSTQWPSGVSYVPANRSGYTIVCAADN